MGAFVDKVAVRSGTANIFSMPKLRSLRREDIVPA
jgi:hypothetical protein